jgi:hypothetical protein
MEPAGSQVPSKGGTKVKQPSPSSQLWVALSLLASPWTLPSPSRLNSCLTLDGDSVSVHFVSGCRLVKHLSRVLVAEHPCRGWWFRPILTTPGDGDEMRGLLVERSIFEDEQDVLLNPKAIEGTRPSFAVFIRRKQCRKKERAVSLPHRTQKEMFYRRVVQHQPGTFRARVFPVCLYLSIERVTELRSQATSICFLP